MSNQKEDSKPITDNNTTQNSNTIINSNSTYENFNVLLTKKSLIDFTQKTIFQIDTNKQIIKIFLNKSQSTRKIDLNSNILLQRQIYLFNKKSEEFVLCNKQNYQNKSKKKIANMTAEEAILRKLLLEMFENQQNLFIVSKEIAPNDYEENFKYVYDDFERRTIKEKKEEERLKNKDNKDALKSFTDFNKEDPVLKNEIKTLFESKYDFEDNLYFRIIIHDVIPQKPNPPNEIKKYIQYVNNMNEEIKKFIEKQNFTEAETWCNACISAVFSMKKDLKKIFNDKKNQNIKKKIYEKMKKIFLNKTYVIEKKNTNNKIKDYNDNIKLITGEYYKIFPNEYDQDYLKITGRLCNYYMNIKNWDEAKKCIDNINNNCKGLENCENLVKDLTEKLNKTQTKVTGKTKQRYEEFFKKNKYTLGFNLGEEEWERSVNQEELNDFLEKESEKIDKLFKYFD